MAANIPSFTLNNGTTIPVVGMGCWMGKSTAGVKEMCTKALAVGYRHFDTAAGYGNEEHVGAALVDSGVPREELYVTTKLGNDSHHRVREAFEESLAKLGCGYVDLYLMHWPQAGGSGGVTLKPEESPTIIDTWKEMEKLLDTGKVKSIGVSNFSVKLLTQLLPHCKVVPATNQVEAHPCLPQTELKEFCEARGILLTAYSPLGRPPAAHEESQMPTLLAEPAVRTPAEKYGVTPAQVLVSWGVQRRTIIIPKSENEGRMRANITLVKLDEAEIKAIDAVHTQPGMHRSLLAYHGTQSLVFGWTYEQLGWDMKPGGIVA